MAIVARLILALSLLIQPMAGIVAARCGPMPMGAATSMPSGQCCCTAGGKGACKMVGKSASACGCRATQGEEPKAPPSGPKTDQSQTDLAVVPVFIGMLPVPQIAVARSLFQPHPWRATHSVQSLL